MAILKNSVIRFFLVLTSLSFSFFATAQDHEMSMENLEKTLHQCIISKLNVSPLKSIPMECDEVVLNASQELRLQFDGGISYAALVGSHWTLASLWDKQLNSFYSQKMISCRNISPTKANVLRKKQREWIHSRDAQVDAMSATDVPDYRIQRVATMRDLTAQRTLELARTSKNCD